MAKKSENIPENIPDLPDESIEAPEPAVETVTIAKSEIAALRQAVEGAAEQQVSPPLTAKGRVFVLIDLDSLEERWFSRPDGMWRVYVEGDRASVDKIVPSLGAFQVRRLDDGSAVIVAPASGMPITNVTEAQTIVGIVRSLAGDQGLPLRVVPRGGKRGATLAIDLARSGGGIHEEQGFTFAAVHGEAIQIATRADGAIVLHPRRVST